MEINLQFKYKDEIKNENEMETEECDDALNEGTNIDVHYMPCLIDHNGPANVKKYFDIYMTTTEGQTSSEKVYKGSFRGYPLKGKEVTAPSGYTFVVMKESKTREDRTMIENERFSNFIHWNVSNEPSSRDPFFQTLKWVDVAEIMHE